MTFLNHNKTPSHIDNPQNIFYYHYIIIQAKIKYAHRNMTILKRYLLLSPAYLKKVKKEIYVENQYTNVLL